MRLLIPAFALLVVASCILAQSSAPVSSPAHSGPSSDPAGGAAPSPAADDEVKELCKSLEASAAEVLKGAKPPADTETKLKGFTVTEQNAAAVKAQLAVNRPDPVSLYVQNRLIQQVIVAKKEVAVGLWPAIKRLTPSPNMYQNYPKYDDSMLSSLKSTPTGANAIDAIAQATKRQDQKMEADRKVFMHNQQVGLLVQNITAMAMIVDNPADDRNVLKLMQEFESAGQYDYVQVVAMIKSAANGMSVERAIRLYNDTKAIGEALIMVKKKYVDQKTATITAATNTVPKQVDDYPGIRILELTNQLATASKRPAVKIPTSKEVDAAQPKSAKGGKKGGG